MIKRVFLKLCCVVQLSDRLIVPRKFIYKKGIINLGVLDSDSTFAERKKCSG